MTQTVIQ